jgi:glycosyltransferase involved in cell wall biosynthesis/phospholipid N-methyltransferase
MAEPAACLSVVMPSYNEAATIETVIRRVLASPYVQELVVVDDGSVDDSVAIVRGIDDPRIRLFVQPINLGKGAALRRGFEEVTAPYVIVQDADLEYDPAEYGEILGPLLSGDADVVYGSRFLSGRPHRVLYYWHSVGNRMLTTASNMFTNLNLTDMETCYKAFRREVIQSIELEEDRFGIEPEVTAKIAAAGWRVYEVGISYSGRTYSEGKKIGWRDGIRAFYGVFHYSPVWQKLRSKLDNAPDRSIPPAEFDDSDAELSDVLRTLEEADNYADWIYGLIEPHLGERVLEIGAGHGELTERLRRNAHVTATDLSKRCVDELALRFAGCTDVEVLQADAAALGAEDRLYDSVVLVNVLEHIDDDVNALADLRSLLKPGGRLCVFVPAFEGLYSDFDRRIGHRRRYRKARLVRTFDRAGLGVLEARYVNTVGALAWWFFSRQLGQVPTQRWTVQLYDNVGVPMIRKLEEGRTPRFGQSLLVIGNRLDEGGGPPSSPPPGATATD